MSKMPNRYVNGVYPKLLVRGSGPNVYDDQSNGYIDFICGLGAILFGYKDWFVDSVVQKSITEGKVLLSLSSPLEGELAELLSQVIPIAHKSKFFKTGSEACSAAVKVARAYTGKNKILVCGYHGWHDWYSVSNDKKAGIPLDLLQYVDKFKYNDISDLKAKLSNGDVAAVIMEPTVYEAPLPGYLEEVAAITRQSKALFIFDEMVTGFRFGLGGAAQYFGVQPDLACYGKALGNGYPIAALVGREEYMNVWERDDFFVSGTYGGDLIGISAALGVIRKLQYDPSLTQTIWTLGEQLKSRFNEMAPEGVKCIGYGPRTSFEFPSVEHKALFWQECLRQGILFGYANFMSSSQTQGTLETTLNATRIALTALKRHWSDPKALLDGDVPVEALRLRA